MSKKLVIVLVIFAVIAIAAGGGFIYFIRSKSSDTPKTPSLPALTTREKKVEAPTADLTYEDQAGFSFKYPKGVSVTDTTPDDDSYYSQVTLTKDGDDMVIKVMDTTAKSLDAWVAASDDIPSTARVTGAVSLAKLSANQYEDATFIYTIALDKSVVYFIRSLKDTDFWEPTHTIVVESFMFDGQSTPQSAANSTTDVIYEEEVVE